MLWEKLYVGKYILKNNMNRNNDRNSKKRNLRNLWKKQTFTPTFKNIVLSFPHQPCIKRKHGKWFDSFFLLQWLWIIKNLVDWVSS